MIEYYICLFLTMGIMKALIPVFQERVRIRQEQMDAEMIKRGREILYGKDGH